MCGWRMKVKKLSNLASGPTGVTKRPHCESVFIRREFELMIKQTHDFKLKLLLQ